MNYDSISSEGVKGFRMSDVGFRVIRASRQNLRRSPSHPKSDIRNPTSSSYELRFDQQRGSKGISDVGCRISGDSSQPPEPATFTKSPEIRHPKSDILFL